MVQRQHGNGRRKTDVLRPRRDVGKHKIRAGEDTERIEMMFSDPGGVHTELVGIKRFIGDIGNELVWRAGVVLVMVIAQREVAEFHGLLPVIVRSSTCNWN